MHTSKTVIVGYGVVGQNLHRELNGLPDIYDKFKTESNTADPDTIYDIAFICVDTPLTSEQANDLTDLHEALRETKAKVLVIKSTVLPEEAERIGLERPNVVFSPEYYGGTQHANNFEFGFTILGGHIKNTTKVQQFLQTVYDARHKFHHTGYKEASLAKYMENSYLAMKVSFCTQFYEISKQLGIPYEVVRELFVLDPRIGESHTFVYDESPYWSSHCLNKDVTAIAQAYEADLLLDMITFNNNQKDLYNPTEI